MAKKRFDVEVPDGQHLGLSRETDGAYRGHLFDNETNELVGHAELHEVDEIDAHSSPVIAYDTNEDAPDSEDPGLLGALALLGVTVAAVMTAEYIKSRRKDKRSKRNRISAAHKDDSQAAIAAAAPTYRAPATQPLEEPRISMSSAEWQELVLAWLKAEAIGEELWRLISNARINDADAATLEPRREMEKLTAQQGADHIKLMLEANPSLRDESAPAEFMKFFGGGRNVDRQYAPLRNETIKETPRLTDGEL